ncbi:glycosyltransferase domain-containing protein, partial [Xanthovirga aplysinae]|uniref:glycosyltransferase domain-containing protein n=1 Tax=Xanthovirga aplysinae TaxID=2529853 RepID=UPI0016572299
MRILTIATNNAGYFALLKQTSQEWGYELKVLGWDLPWKGLIGRLRLYVEELKKIPSDEIITCVDGYDVIVVGSSTEMLTKFREINKPIVLSGQRYFPNQKWMQRIADEQMNYQDLHPLETKRIGKYDYSRPCMGLLMGYSGSLITLFERLLKMEKEHQIGNDQILLNMHYQNHPESFYLDNTCSLFQNLWRTRNGLYGKISTNDEAC